MLAVLQVVIYFNICFFCSFRGEIFSLQYHHIFKQTRHRIFHTIFKHMGLIVSNYKASGPSSSQYYSRAGRLTDRFLQCELENPIQHMKKENIYFLCTHKIAFKNSGMAKIYRLTHFIFLGLVEQVLQQRGFILTIVRRSGGRKNKHLKESIIVERMGHSLSPDKQRLMQTCVTAQNNLLT